MILHSERKAFSFGARGHLIRTGMVVDISRYNNRLEILPDGLESVQDHHVSACGKRLILKLKEIGRGLE